MEEAKKRLKVYCETTFWSYLNGRPTSLAHIALSQAATLQWWQEIAPSCDIYVSQYVNDEVLDGDSARAEMRKRSIAAFPFLDIAHPDIKVISNALIAGHAVPQDETTDAFHIATASVHGMDVLLTWNCRHMANPVTLPTTAMIIRDEGYRCPIIITPSQFMERKEEFGYGN